MDPEEANFPPGPPPIQPIPAIPIALQYSSLQPIRPGIITATGVIGIIIAVLGFLSAAYGALTGISLSYVHLGIKWQTTGALTVTISEAIVGVALAITLLIGSSGLLRQRSWSRRVLLWWVALYLTSLVIFLLLQILIVVPSQTAMFTSIMATMPTAAPSTNPAGTAATTSPAAIAFNYQVTVNGGPATSTAFPAAAGPSQAMMVSLMSYGYMIAAVAKALFCLIFPIAVLIVMQLKSVRGALKAEPA